MTRNTLRNRSLGARLVFGALVLIELGSCTQSPPVSSPVSSPQRSAEIDWLYSGAERRVPMVSTSLGSNQFYYLVGKPPALPGRLPEFDISGMSQCISFS